MGDVGFAPRTLWVRYEEALAALRNGRGDGVRIAVVDSGVEVAHPDLAGLVLRDDVHVIESGVIVRAVPGDGTDLCGHGTAIAGIIRKLAPAAEIGSFRVLDAAIGSKTVIIAEGIRQALDRGYHIINCSFGCGLAEHLPAYKAWIDEAYLKGVHVVAACNNDDYTRPEWPGCFPSVIAVNFGHTDPDVFYYRGGHLVEFFAEGTDVDVAWKNGRRKRLSGSSFAAPHVTALLARLVSRWPTLPPLLAKAAMQQLARAWEREVAATNVPDLEEPTPVDKRAAR